MSNELPEWISTHKKAIIDLYENVNSFQVEDVTDACNIFVAVSEMKTSIALIFDEIQKKVLDALDNDVVNVDENVSVEKRWSTPRKAWRHQELTDEVTRRIMQMSIDMDTGERILTTEEMMKKLMDFVNPSYWRVKALNEIGISADQYCEVGESKPSIYINKPKNN